MPPLSQEQKQAVRDAWARGIRDKGTLYAAAGIGLPGTPTGVVPAARPAPPPPSGNGEGFIEQGGLLGLAARAPGTKQALQGLGWLGENILDPSATLAVTTAQAFIPGQQMRERVMDEAYEAARERGVGPLAAGWQSIKAAGHGQFDTPITTGLGINLPGEGIPIPEWLVGPGKRLDEIDIGQLAAELPAEILGTKGAAKLTRPARFAAASKLAGVRGAGFVPGQPVSGVSGLAPYLIKPARTNLSRKYRRGMAEEADILKAAPRSEWGAVPEGMVRTTPGQVAQRNIGIAQRKIREANAVIKRAAVTPADAPTTKPVAGAISPVSRQPSNAIAAMNEGYVPFYVNYKTRVARLFRPGLGRRQGLEESIEFEGIVPEDAAALDVGLGRGQRIETVGSPQDMIAVTTGRRIDRLGDAPSKAPQQWADEAGIKVLDPDGWRSDGLSWDEPITKAEFDRRAAVSTIEAGGAPPPRPPRPAAAVPTRGELKAARLSLARAKEDLKFARQGLRTPGADIPRDVPSARGISEAQRGVGPFRPEIGGFQRTGALSDEPGLDLPKVTEEIPRTLLYDPTKSPFYDPATQRIPAALIEVEEIRLRNLAMPVDKRAVQVAARAEVMPGIRRHAVHTKRLIANLMTPFLGEIRALNFNRLVKALRTRDAARAKLASAEKAVNDKLAKDTAAKGKTEDQLKKLGQDREDLLDSIEATFDDVASPGGRRRQVEIDATWDAKKRAWLADQAPKPKVEEIVAAGSTASPTVIKKLKAIAKQELDLEFERARYENSIRSLTHKNIKKVLRSDLALRLENTKKVLQPLEDAVAPLLEEVRKILAKDFSGLEEVVTGTDLLNLSNLSPYMKGILARALREEDLVTARRPDFVLEMSPEDIKIRIAESAAESVRRVESNNALRRVLAGQIRSDTEAMRTVFMASARRLFDDPVGERRRGDLTVRSADEPIASEIGSPGRVPPLEGVDVGGNGNPPRGTVAGPSDVTPDPQGVPKYISEDGLSIKSQRDGFLNSTPPMFARLAEWVTKTTAYSGAGTTAKWTAAFANATLGSVNRWIVNNSRAMATIYSYSSKLNNRLGMAHKDVINFIQKGYLGVGTTKLDGIYRFYPMDLDNGRWGNTAFQANDIAEAYWLHKFMGDNSYVGDVKKFLSTKKEIDINDPATLTKAEAGTLAPGGFGSDFNRFFKNSDKSFKNRAERNAAWEQFFRETTDLDIGTRAGEFLDGLGDFLDEIEQMIDPSIKVGRDAAGVRLLSRNVANFKSGQRAFTMSSQHAKRFYETMGEGVEAGVRYNHNLIAHLVHYHAYAAKIKIDRELRAVILDRDDGFALATDGLARRLTSIMTKDGFENLDDGTKEYITGIQDKLNKINGAGLSDTKLADAKRKLDREILDNIGTGTKELQIPSTMFWANNLEGKMSLTSLHNIYGIGQTGTGGPKTGQLAEDLLRRLGIEETALISRRELSQLEEAFKGVEHLQGVATGSADALRGPGWTGMKFQQVVDFWRLASTGFDAAYSMTLGYPLIFRDPLGWKRMTVANIQAFWDPNVFAKMMQRDPLLKADMDFLIDMRIGVGDQEVYKFLQTDGRINKNTYYDMLRTDRDANGLNFHKIVAKGATPFQRSYNTGTILTRVYWLRALRPGFTVNGKVDVIGLKSAIERITGAINQTELGATVGRRRLENFWVGLSPRLTRSVASVVYDAHRAVVEIVRRGDKEMLRFSLSQGKFGKSPLQVAQEIAEREGRTLDGRELAAARELTKQAQALGNLSTMMAATAMTFYSTSYGLAIMSGMSHEEASQRAGDSLNPLEGKKFMAIEIGGDWYGVGGFFRSLSQLNAKFIETVYEGTRGNYGPLNDLRSISQFENPLIMTMRNRGAPAVNFFGAAVEGVTASMGSPVDAAPFDTIDNIYQAGYHMGSSFLPFAVQGIVDGEGLPSLFGMTGARTSKQTLGDASVHIARKAMDLDVSSTKDMPESWLKSDVLYPLVEEQYGLPARASNSAFGQFMRRRGELKSAFETLIAKEWAAGNTNYEMIGYYFDERNIMNAKIEEFKKAVGMDDMEVHPRDPIAMALKQWRDIWESEEVVQAVKDERWDIIEEKRENLMKGFTPEQQAAVRRSGSGIHREILQLMKPESQERYFDLFNLRKNWIISTTRNPEYAKTLVLHLTEQMFPTIGVPRGITTESVGTPSRVSRGSYGTGVSISPKGIQDVAISPSRTPIAL